MKMNQLTRLLGVLALTVFTLQSCQRDPIPDPDCGFGTCPTGCEEPAFCKTEGVVTYLPLDCNLGVSEELGIQSKAGKFFFIRKDLTGKFSGLPEGTPVTFGYTDDVYSGSCVLTQNCNKPTADFCIELNCLTADIPTCGNDGRDNPKKDPEPHCTTTATVVSYTHTGSNVKGEAKLLRINGKHYAPQGFISSDINKLADGTQVSISYVVEDDCFLPSVITTPTIDGCVRLGCFQDRTVGN